MITPLTIAELRMRAAQLRLQAARIPEQCNASQYQRLRRLNAQANDYENLLDMALRARDGEGNTCAGTVNIKRG